MEESEFLKEIIMKKIICDVLEAMESENLHPEFLVDTLSYFKAVKPLQEFQTPLPPNAGIKAVRLDFEGKQVFITSTAKQGDKIKGEMGAGSDTKFFSPEGPTVTEAKEGTETNAQTPGPYAKIFDDASKIFNQSENVTPKKLVDPFSTLR